MVGILLMGAAAKKRQDDERREKAVKERRQEQLKKDKKAKRRAHYAQDTYSFEYSYMDCVIKEMTMEIEKYPEGRVDNKGKITLIGFCEEFKKMYETITLEDTTPLIDEAERIKEQIDQEREKQLQIQKNLGDKFDTIKRLGLSIDILKNNPSIFREKYNRLTENIKEEILMINIKKLKQKIKYLPFRKHKNELLLGEKERELKEIQEAKSQAEEFERLSIQDKEGIMEYLQSEGIISTLDETLEQIRYKIVWEQNCINKDEGGGRDFKKMQDRSERTLGRMINEGKISDKDLDDIYRKLDKVGIKARRGEYDFSSWCVNIYSKAEAYKEFLKWFIENVYEEDEQFLERNTEEEECEPELY